MTTLVDSSVFNNFGKISYQQTSTLGTDYIQDATYSDNRFDVLKQFCHNVLTLDIDFNLLQLHNLVYHLTNQNPNSVDNVIIQAFDESTKQISEQLTESIKNNSFTITSFIELYKKYYTRTIKLSKYLSYFDTKIIVNDIQSKYSHIGLIRTYMFYKNIINKKYTNLDNKEYYLYEIFNKSIEDNTVSMEEIIQLFKMYSFYIRLSHTSKTNKEEMFNDEINKLFLITLGSNKKFVQTLTQYIHNNIKNLANDKNKLSDQNKTIENNIGELINLVSNHFLEKDMFNMFYEQLFEMRLLNTEVDFDLEKKLISKFKRPVDNKIIQNMIYKLDDIAALKIDRTYYENIKVSITSDKYKNKLNVAKMNPKMINAKLFRFYAWTYTRNTDQDELTAPFELCPYIDIYNGFYKSKYPNRDIVWNFNHGIAVINLTLGLNTYTVQLTTPQLFVLLQFNEQAEIKASDLAINLGISMAKLGLVLNTLLCPRILKRETGTSASNPDLKISLNHNFTYATDSFSLISLMENPQRQKAQENEITEKFASGRETILQACIVRSMKISKHMTYGDLFNRVKVSIPFQIDESKFSEVLKSTEEALYVKNNGDGTYDYIEDDDE